MKKVGTMAGAGDLPVVLQRLRDPGILRCPTRSTFYSAHRTPARRRSSPRGPGKASASHAAACIAATWPGPLRPDHIAGHRHPPDPRNGRRLNALWSNLGKTASREIPGGYCGVGRVCAFNRPATLGPSHEIPRGGTPPMRENRRPTAPPGEKALQGRNAEGR